MPSKREFQRVRRLQVLAYASVIAIPIGGACVLFGALDVLARRPGGAYGVALGLPVIAGAVVAIVRALRNYDQVASSEWEKVRAHGRDDGLPLGAYRDSQGVSLEANDLWLLAGTLSTAIGFLFFFLALANYQETSNLVFLFTLVGFCPAALFFRRGSGVPYRLTNEGLVRRNRRVPAVRWDDVERIIPNTAGRPIPATSLGAADCFELHKIVESRGRIRSLWRGSRTVAVQVRMVEVDGPALFKLLQERMPDRPRPMTSNT
jgi:hypothetical protein